MRKFLLLLVMLLPACATLGNLPPESADCRNPIFACHDGYECVPPENGGLFYQCKKVETPVTPATCASIQCPAGMQCLEDPNGALCVNTPPVVEPPVVQPPVEPPVNPPTTPGTYSLADCPKGGLAPGAYAYIVANHYPTKVVDPTSEEGKDRPVDSSIRVHGDPAFCAMISGIASNDCHLEGWPKRAQCEAALTGGCPTWEYRLLGTPEDTPGISCVQQPSVFSCDHFGDPQGRDDPMTPEFEGQPAFCGLQRDEQGHPKAGPFTAPHGNGYVRARTADGKQVSGWVRVDR